MVEGDVNKIRKDVEDVSLWAAAQPNGLEAPPIDQIEVTTPEAAFACDREIRIDKRDRVAVSVAPSLDIKRHPNVIIAGALLIALSLGLGWIAGSNSDFFNVNSASLPVKQVNPSTHPPDPAKSDRLEVLGSPTNPTPTATAIGRAHETSKSGVQTTHLVSPKQNTSPPGPTAGERTKMSTRPTPVSETRPTTIEGWTVREVTGGTAVLEGPNGIWKAMRGDAVPGVGKIDSIVRWGNRWIVATSRGLISTP
jgi:hypothetical protein